MHSTLRFLTRTSAATVALATTVTLTACGSTTATGGSSSSTAVTGATLTLVDGWCKSTDTMPEGFKDMTGCFGTLKNTGNTDIQVTGGMSSAAQMIQTHETVKAADGTMKMQEAKGGFAVKAGSGFDLKPGANHVMLIMLTKPLQIGDSIPVTLKTSAGDVAVTFQARAFDAANETYVPVK